MGGYEEDVVRGTKRRGILKRLREGIGSREARIREGLGLSGGGSSPGARGRGRAYSVGGDEGVMGRPLSRELAESGAPPYGTLVAPPGGVRGRGTTGGENDRGADRGFSWEREHPDHAAAKKGTASPRLGGRGSAGGEMLGPPDYIEPGSSPRGAQKRREKKVDFVVEVFDEPEDDLATNRRMPPGGAALGRNMERHEREVMLRSNRANYGAMLDQEEALRGNLRREERREGGPNTIAMFQELMSPKKTLDNELVSRQKELYPAMGRAGPLASGGPRQIGDEGGLGLAEDEVADWGQEPGVLGVVPTENSRVSQAFRRAAGTSSSRVERTVSFAGVDEEDPLSDRAISNMYSGMTQAQLDAYTGADPYGVGFAGAGVGSYAGAAPSRGASDPGYITQSSFGGVSELCCK